MLCDGKKVNPDRKGEVEFLRIIFAVGIFLFHSKALNPGGYLGVEFFFMVSGALMAKSLSENKELNAAKTLSETCNNSLKYIRKRIISVFPYFLLSTISGCAVTAVACHRSTNVESLIGDLLFLQNYGFSVLSSTGVLWYLWVFIYGS